MIILQAKCILKLYPISHLQGPALEYELEYGRNSELVKGGNKNGFAKVGKRYYVKSLETIGPCCWRICRNKRGDCEGRTVDGRTRVKNLREIDLYTKVRRVQAVKNQDCKTWKS